MVWGQLCRLLQHANSRLLFEPRFQLISGTFKNKIFSEPDFSPKLSQKKRLVPRVTKSTASSQLNVYHLHGSHCRRAVLFCHPWIGTRGTLRLINFSFIFPVSSDSFVSAEAAVLSTCDDDRFLSARVRGNPLLRAHTSWVYLGLSTVMRALILFDFKLYHRIGVMSSDWFFLPESLSQNNWQ